MFEPDHQLHDQFLRLFMVHEPSLRVYVRSLLFTGEDESDVMQDVAVVLWRKFDPTLDSEAFCRWAFGVARMEVLTFRRDRARDRLQFSEDIYQLLSETVYEQSNHLEAERRALESCVKKLPEERRQLIEAAYAPGVQIDQMAAQMGKTAMALYKSLHRIRLTLIDCTRQVLAAEGR